MKPIYTVAFNEFQRMTTDELRATFLLENLYQSGKIELMYWEVDRTVVGGAVPTTAPLALEVGKELAADYFCQRRELGVMNLGGNGKIIVDGEEFSMEYTDCLYVGRGAKEVVFSSDNAENPAKFYLLSYPAHMSYPTTQAKKSDANPIQMGSIAESNKRTIFQYIHPNGIKSCQLVMGFTVLEEGSVWNTMKPHTHERRTEVYTYFDVAETDAVFHMMGTASETRHIVTRNLQTTLSPIWSIHAGCGTRAYSFIWGMGGENQDFTDMDHIEVSELK